MGRRKRNSPSQFMTNYLVSRDGKTLGIFEGYSEQQAIDRAQQYHGSGRYVAIKDPVKLSAWTFAKRENNALENFVENVQEQFGLTRQEAIDALQAYIRLKAVKLDRRMGRYQLTAGDYWEKPVLLRAVQLQREYMAKQTSKRKQNKTLIKADRIEHLDVARVHNPRYLVSRDGVEVGIFPGFNALMAINAARKIYGAGKYTSVKTGEAMYLGRGALETERREREAQAARAAAKAQAKRDKIQLPKGKGTRTRRTVNAEFDGMPKSIEFGARHRRTIDFGRRKRGAERDLVMAYADHLLRAVLAQNWALDDPALYLELSNKAKTAARRKHKIDPTRAALLLDQAEEIMQGERRNPGEDFNPPVRDFDKRRKQLLTYRNTLRGAERELVTAYADILSDLFKTEERRFPVQLRHLGELSLTTVLVLGRKNFPIESNRAAQILQQADKIMLGTKGLRERLKDRSQPSRSLIKDEYLKGQRRNPEGDVLQQGVKANLIPAGLVTDLQRLAAGRFPANPAQRKNLLTRAIKVRSDLIYQNMLAYNPLGEAVQRALQSIIEKQVRRVPGYSYNPAEKDAEHPIEVTRHFRGGPPGYLSPWQKAMAIGQAELFDTGIKLAPRAAELRAARLSNPGATKVVYQSGLKQATAAQLGRLARVGLRVGRTPTEIRSDLAATGRFTAEQIRRGLDQATTAEKRSNPPRRSRRNPPVREIYETFNGRPATRENSVDAPRGTPARVAQLGRLRLIRTRDGKTWKFPGDRAPFLAADSRGKLHVVGGAYRANPAGESCGEIEQIEYQTSKPHLGHENETIYYHQLGEETGVMPELEITPEGHLKIVGGDYRIEADGIHN